MLDIGESIGIVAGICTTFSMVPQVIKLWRSKSTKDISLGMYIIACVGIILWIIHGFYVDSRPLIIANVVTLLLASSILTMKIKWK